MASQQLSSLRWLAPLLAAGLAVTCLALTVRCWDWLTEDGEEIRSVVIRNSILVAGALVTFVLAIWRSLIAERQLEIAREQSATAQRSHLEGRYQNAAEMLHSNVLSIRLGAIHVLDQMARDHPDDFHIQVMRLFAAFVRHPVEYVAPLASDGSEGGVKPPPSPREDIQVIMVSVAGRTAKGREIERHGNYVLDLRGADLRRVWFPHDTCLKGIRLSGARLSGVDGLTQGQLDEALAEPGVPPILEGARDCQTKSALEWRLPPPGLATERGTPTPHRNLRECWRLLCRRFKLLRR